MRLRRCTPLVSSIKQAGLFSPALHHIYKLVLRATIVQQMLGLTAQPEFTCVEKTCATQNIHSKSPINATKRAH